MLTDNFELTDEFEEAFNKINNSNQSFFITGKAGTGKTSFLKYLKANSKKKIVFLAPTGIAAVNCEGVTIHSFFRFPLGSILYEDKRIIKFKNNSEKRNIMEKLDTVVIDEVSMVRADILDAIDVSLRRNCNNNVLFGGKQIILIGDIFQLEPIQNKDRIEHSLFETNTNNPFFFNAMSYKDKKFDVINFNKVYRQSDNEFIEILDKIRKNNHSFLDLEIINQRVFSSDNIGDNEYVINLTSRNDIASRINNQKLNLLPDKTFLFEGKIESEYDLSKSPTDVNLCLKVGAQVMFIRNDVEHRWVNGTIGKILSTLLIKKR